jgi:hypothetical protein
MMAAAALAILAPDRICFREANEVFISAFWLLSVCLEHHRAKQSLRESGEFVARGS